MSERGENFKNKSTKFERVPLVVTTWELLSFENIRQLGNFYIFFVIEDVYDPMFIEGWRS